MQSRIAIGIATATATLALAACGNSTSAERAALTVNGTTISAQQYDAAVAALRGRLEQHTGHAINITTPSGKQAMASIKAAAVRDLVAQTVVDQLAAQHHVSVSDGDVSSTLQRLQQTAGSADDLVAELAASGLSDGNTRAAVRTLLLQQQLRAVLGSGYDTTFANAVQHATVSGDAAN
jgi:SurA N-terminal domain